MRPWALPAILWILVYGVIAHAEWPTPPQPHGCFAVRLPEFVNGKKAQPAYFWMDGKPIASCPNKTYQCNNICPPYPGSYIVWYVWAQDYAGIKKGAVSQMVVVPPERGKVK